MGEEAMAALSPQHRHTRIPPQYEHTQLGAIYLTLARGGGEAEGLCDWPGGGAVLPAYVDACDTEPKPLYRLCLHLPHTRVGARRKLQGRL